MKVRAKYDENFLMQIYNILTNGLNSYFYTSEDWEPLDDIIFSALRNNNCAYKESDKPMCEEFSTNDPDLMILFVNNMLGNDVNEYYDIIECYGVYYLIIFPEYFKDIKTELPDPDDESIKALASKAMGNSVYYDALCKIVRVFIMLTYNPVVNLQEFLSTSVAMNLRRAQSIIAIFILDTYREIQQEDIPDVPIADAIKYLEYPLSLLLMGIGPD